MKHRIFSLLSVSLLVAIGVSAANAANDGLEIGETGPAFTLEDTEGGKVSLADYAGKIVVAVFYRGQW